MLWEHHCGEASRKVLEAGIDPQFYKTDDNFSPVMLWDHKNASMKSLAMRWRDTYSRRSERAVNGLITKTGKAIDEVISLTCTLPERRPAPLNLYSLECETKEQQSLLQEVFADLEAALAEIKKFSEQVDELLNSAKTLDQLKELSPTLAAWVDVPEPKKHLPMPVETANAVNETLNKLKEPKVA